jgi:hypothetical protein
MRLGHRYQSAAYLSGTAVATESTQFKANLLKLLMHGSPIPPRLAYEFCSLGLGTFHRHKFSNPAGRSA